MKSIKEAIYKKDGIMRSRVNLNKSNGFYQLEITSYDKEGYYRAADSFTLAEYSVLGDALEYFDALLEKNKNLNLIINEF